MLAFQSFLCLFSLGDVKNHTGNPDRGAVWVALYLALAQDVNIVTLKFEHSVLKLE